MHYKTHQRFIEKAKCPLLSPPSMKMANIIAAHMAGRWKSLSEKSGETFGSHEHKASDGWVGAPNMLLTVTHPPPPHTHWFYCQHAMFTLTIMSELCENHVRKPLRSAAPALILDQVQTGDDIKSEHSAALWSFCQTSGGHAHYVINANSYIHESSVGNYKKKMSKWSAALFLLNVAHERSQVLFIFSGLKWAKCTKLELLVIQLSSQFSLFVGRCRQICKDSYSSTQSGWMRHRNLQYNEDKTFCFWEQGPWDNFSSLYFTAGRHKSQLLRC